MKISEIITDKYKLRIPPTVYYELLADVREVEEDQEPTTKNDLGFDCISRKQAIAAFPDLLPNMGYNKKAITEILQDLPPVTPQPCEDAISRQEVLDLIADYDLSMGQVVRGIHALPSVTSQPRKGHCKDCKYFEYDSLSMVDGMPLIVAHEICSKWGNGCKTSENGYCFLFEPKAAMREVKE